MTIQLALAAKDLEHEIVRVADIGDPSGLPKDMHDVPALVYRETCVTQPLAIIEFLNELEGEVSLYPDDSHVRAAVRSFVQVIASEILPWEQGRLSGWLVQEAGVGEQRRKEWFLFCLGECFAHLEQRLAHQARTGTFCFGEAITLADFALLPQVVFARRAGLSMAAYPHIERICENCLDIEWCRAVVGDQA